MGPLQSSAASRPTGDNVKRSSKSFFKSLFAGAAPSTGISGGSTTRSATAQGKVCAVPPPQSGSTIEAGYVVVGSQLPDQVSRLSSDSLSRSCNVPMSSLAQLRASDRGVRRELAQPRCFLAGGTSQSDISRSNRHRSAPRDYQVSSIRVGSFVGCRDFPLPSESFGSHFIHFPQY